jgi:hypothetical protein
MGQIILSQTNERFENCINDIVKQNIGKRLEFVFSSANSGKIEKTETIKVDWEKGNVIVVSQASTDYGSTIGKVHTNKYIYIDGYFSDFVKEKGNYLEVIKTGDKNLVIKGYRDGKLAIENKITLDNNKETIFADHANYYAGSATKPVRTITSYSKKIVDKSTTVTKQESYDIVSGVKKLNHKFETTEISSFDKKTNKKTITCKIKATLSIGPQLDSESKRYETYDSAGKIIKVEYPDKYLMSVIYK